ncbi:MAG: hypothetical protein EON47_09450 [Acetobacteraceae bacterium]|nr:MAG: hypothetical protein EON47_09450 [Acetobacteraceae bacterium]
MISSRVFFLVLSVVIALVGLWAAAVAHDYMHVFGLGLFAFGTLFALSCVKRHFDEQDARH